MSEIVDVHAREILDSRGNPTLEVEIVLESGVMGRAAVPSGASTGEREALEMRDGNAKRYFGKGVLKAIDYIDRKISKEITGLPAAEQSMIDAALIALDGTPNKRALGANTLLAVSLAVAKSAAEEAGVPLYRHIGGLRAEELPVPLMNIINGGVHADNGLDFQEFMIVPAGAATFSESLRMGVEVFHHLKAFLKKGGYATAVGDEGGFAPRLKSHQEALSVIVTAIREAGYLPGTDVFLALDVAASGFYQDGKYHLASEGKRLSSEEMIDYYADLMERFPILSIEDGLSENDWKGWRRMTDSLGRRVQLVGDDLFVTHEKLLARGIREGVANAILIKPNQVGTLTETLSAVGLAQRQGYATIVSHRSGETEDTTIADLAVGVGAGQIKCGSASRTDRTAKYNQLLRIEEELEDFSRFRGKEVYRFSSAPRPERPTLVKA